MSLLPPSDESLSAWLDGELNGDALAQVERWLEQHPQDAERVHAWRADRDALRAQFQSQVQAPMASDLQAWVLGRGPKPVSKRAAPVAHPRSAAANAPGWGSWRTWQVAAAAAGVFIAGGVVGGAWVAQHDRVVAQTAPSVASPLAWTQRATAAHVVYAPEVRHPVEVSVNQGDATEQRAQEEHLARWLTKRLATPVKLFDLRSFGFELVGGRLLPDGGNPGAQLMYQNPAGQRVTVYLRKPEGPGTTAFRFERDGELSMFYWVDGVAGYALVGPLPRERLLALAESIYQQGQPKP